MGRKAGSVRRMAMLMPFLLAGVSIAAQSAPPFFERAEIDAHPPKNPWIKIVADLDGDGQPDAIIGGAGGPLVWYRNPGWSRRVIAEKGYESVDGEAADGLLGWREPGSSPVLGDAFHEDAPESRLSCLAKMVP